MVVPPCQCALGVAQGCIAGSHRPDALVGPDKTSPLGAGHVPWGVPPWPPEVDCDVTRVRGQPGDCGAAHSPPATRLALWPGLTSRLLRWGPVFFTERLVHSTVPWTGKGERRKNGEPFELDLGRELTKVVQALSS